jgi:hypothetical protein
MRRVRPVGPQNEIVVPLRVPLFGNEGNDIIAAIPELEAYLKTKSPRVKEVRLAYRNPVLDNMICLGTYLHEAEVTILLVGGLFTKRIAERFADDAYNWLKKRFKKIRKERRRRSRQVEGETEAK